jgi:hypothetical protein
MFKKIILFSFTFLVLTSVFAQNATVEKAAVMGKSNEENKEGEGKKYLAPGFTFGAIAGLNIGVVGGNYHLIVEDDNYKYLDETYALTNSLGGRFGISAAFQTKRYGAEVPIIFNVDRFGVKAIADKSKIYFSYIQFGINNHFKFNNENSFFLVGLHIPIQQQATPPVYLSLGYGQKFFKRKFGIDLSYQFNLNTQTNDGSKLITVSKTLGTDKSGSTINYRNYSYGMLTLNFKYDIFTTRKEQYKKPKPIEAPKVKQEILAVDDKKVTEDKLAKQKLAEKKREDQRLAKQKIVDEKNAKRNLAIKKREDQKVASQKSVELKLAEIKLAEQKMAEEKAANEKLAAAEQQKAAEDTIQMRGNGRPLKGININNAIKELKVGNYYALIIGIDEYNGTSWRKLKNGVNDAKAMEQLLKTKYKFEVFKTLYNAQATRAKIIESLEWLVANVKSNDNVLIYYSGHGEMKKELNKGYWVPADANSNSVSQFISNSDLQTFLGGIKSKHTLLMSDACFSGDIFRGNTVSIPFENSEKYYSKVYEQMSRQAISSGGIEPVMDGGKEGHSVFAYYVLKALKSNDDKYYDASQLFEKIKIPIINNSNQTPDFSSIKNTDDEGGHFIFIKK